MILLFILIGVVSGALTSIIGTGAGIVIIPALVYFAHFSQKTAVGTSLTLLLAPIGFFAATTYHRHGYVNFKAAGFIIIGFVISSFFVSKISTSLPTAVLSRGFGVFAVLIGIRMIFFS